jgi:hypothetical protein
MKKIISDSYLLLLFGAFAVTIAMTPWVNSDSLIIPKLAILLTISMYLLPRLIADSRSLYTHKLSKIVLIITLATFLQLLLVLIFTNSPFEQQFYGRTGRGLGFITEFSILIIFLVSYLRCSIEKVNYLFVFFIGACIVSSIYSLLQRFNLDVFDWNTRTNGIIGTLGNPNFQGSFAAMALVPTLFFFLGTKFGILKSLLFSVPLIAVIYVCESTQGYVSAFLGVLSFLVIYFWYKHRLVFYGLTIFSLTSIGLILQGILNNGPLSTFLYKPSVASRGEMLRNSFAAALDHPIFGVGLDSLGDFYLKYKDARTATGVNEFTDHAHNLFVQNAAVGGFPLAALQLVGVALVIYVFILYMKKNKEFDKQVSILFSVWVCYQAQGLISPANISMIVWNSIISGTILGVYREKYLVENKQSYEKKPQLDLTRPFSILLLLISLVVIYPYYNVDKMQAQSSKTGNGELAMRSALSFPESTVRYSRIANAFIDSNLAPQALELGRAAAKFNPNAPSAWGLILVNNLATRDERIKAKNELIKLDPQNLEIKNFIIP